jgi:hypothetical protein
MGAGRMNPPKEAWFTVWVFYYHRGSRVIDKEWFHLNSEHITLETTAES